MYVGRCAAIGSDVLSTVSDNIVKMIEDAGGTVAFRI